jgi:uncharacterized protein YcbK (DUF882 family)
MESVVRAKALCLLGLFAIHGCASAQLLSPRAQRPGPAASGADVREPARVRLASLEPLTPASHEPEALTLDPERTLLAPELRFQLALSALSAVPTGSSGDVEQPPTVIQLLNANTRETLSLEVSRDGHVSPESEALVETFFKCRRSGRAHAIEPGVLRVVASIAREYPEHVIEVVSGFRTQPYGVKDSKHFQGRAIDLRVRGVKLTKVRDFVWKTFADIGVGYYGHQNFIHVDHRPDRKDTAWSSAHENAAYEFNPRWALRIRAPWQPPLESVSGPAHEHSQVGELAHDAQASLTTAL